MIYITGDIHGDVMQISKFCRKMKLTEKDVVILLGDVGLNYYGDERDTFAKARLNSSGPVFFCIHGNHENRPQNIQTYRKKQWHYGKVMYELRYPKILFPIDGEIFKIGNRKAIVIGGAYSVDKEYRLLHGWNWYPDEQPSEHIKRKTEKNLEKENNKIDFIFSHTCPFKYEPVECFLSFVEQDSVDDSTEKWLDKIEEKTEYGAWYCGHWHTNKDIDKIHFLFHDVKELEI